MFSYICCTAWCKYCSMSIELPTTKREMFHGFMFNAGPHIQTHQHKVTTGFADANSIPRTIFLHVHILKPASSQSLKHFCVQIYSLLHSSNVHFYSILLCQTLVFLFSKHAFEASDLLSWQYPSRWLLRSIRADSISMTVSFWCKSCIRVLDLGL